MNIGIDIDGVIQDCERWFRTYAEIFDIDNVGRGVVNPNGVKVQERMGWDKSTFEKYLFSYMHMTMKNAPLMPGCKEVIGRLREMGHRLFVITARGTFTDREVELAEEMLERNGLVFDGIHCKSKDKLVECRQEKIDYMIDDSYTNVLRLSENGIKCLYFREYGSKDIISDDVIDVRNWGEILRFFLKFEKK